MSFLGGTVKVTSKWIMATSKKRGNWKTKDLEKAIQEVSEGKISVREAEAKYSIPKSMITPAPR